MDTSSVMASSDGNVIAGIVGAILGFGAIAIVIGSLLGILWYVLQAIGFYKMSKDRDIEPAWISWIPVAQNYLFGELIGDKVWGFGYAKWILVITPILSVLITSFSSSYNDFVSIILSILLIVFYVYKMTALYKLYKIYSDHAVLFLVLSVIFPFLSSIFIFAIRNHEPNMAEVG